MNTVYFKTAYLTKEEFVFYAKKDAKHLILFPLY